MTEEKRICPFMPVFTVRDYRGMLPAQLGRDYSECLEEKCMAWAPEHEARRPSPYTPKGEPIKIPGHCRLISFK